MSALLRGCCAVRTSRIFIFGLLLCLACSSRQARLDEFGRAFSRLMTQGQLEEARAYLDFEAYFRRLTEGSTLSEAQLSKLKKQYGEAWSQGAGILEPNRGEIWSLARVEPPDHLVFRVLRSDGTLDYRRFTLSPDLAVVDIYVFRSGASMAESGRKMLMALEQDRSAQTTRMVEFYRYLQDDRPERALSVYHDLPPSLREQKSILLACVAAASRLDERAYEKAVLRMSSLYPEDPALSLLAYDRALARQQADEALTAVDELQEKLGFEDTYLNFMRAECAVLRDRPAVARALLEKCVAAEPETEYFHWALLERLEAEGDFATLSERLAGLEPFYADGAELLESMGTMELLPKFRASAEGQMWRHSVQKKDPGSPG